MALKRISKGFGFDKNLDKFKKFERRSPKIIANNSLNHFLEGFRKGGRQTDSSKTGWAKRQNESKGRAILVDTGALRRSVKVLKHTFKDIIIGTNRIAYAKRHNEGLKGMPEREFIGDSKELTKDNVKILLNLLSKVMK